MRVYNISGRQLHIGSDVIGPGRSEDLPLTEKIRLALRKKLLSLEEPFEVIIEKPRPVVVWTPSESSSRGPESFVDCDSNVCMQHYVSRGRFRKEEAK